MPRFLFTTGITRGSYTAVESDGELREVAGLDLVLGLLDGADVNEAKAKFLSTQRDLPAYMQKYITVFEVGKATRLPYDGKISSEELRENVPLGGNGGVAALSAASAPVKNDVTGGYKAKKCDWCSEEVPSNGAAQFSHLKKHINALVAKNALTKEQGVAIRKLKLEPDILKIFTEFFKK